MLTFHFTVTGSQRVENRLRRGAAAMPATTDKVLGAWAQRTRGKLKATPYPAKRPGQRYVRTGRYRNSWTARREKAGKWAIINNARNRYGRPYPVYVGGDNKGGGQAWMHRGRHKISRQTIDGEVPQLRQELRQAVLKEFGE
jgi:hypothetical protein